jgi:hypothetical protein
VCQRFFAAAKQAFNFGRLQLLPARKLLLEANAPVPCVQASHCAGHAHRRGDWRGDRRGDWQTYPYPGASIALKHYGRAHTDRDISLTLAKANILHAWDTYWNGVYRFIDYSTGGGIDGMSQPVMPIWPQPTPRRSSFLVTLHP